MAPPAPGLGRSTAIAGGTPEATGPLLARPEVARGRRPGPGRPGPRRASASAGRRRALIAAARRTPSPTVRLQAIIALGRIGDAEAVPALLPVLADPDALPRLLGPAGPPADRRLEGGGRRARRRPTRRSAPASWRRWSWSTTPTPSPRSAGFAADPSAAGRRAGQGPDRTWRRSTARPSPGTASGGAPGRPQGKPPAKVDRLGGDAASSSRRSASAWPTRSPRSGSRRSPPSRRRTTATPCRRSASGSRPSPTPTVRREIAAGPRRAGRQGGPAAPDRRPPRPEDPRAGPRRRAGGRRGDRRPTLAIEALVDLLERRRPGRRAPAPGDRRPRPVQGRGRPSRRWSPALDEPDAEVRAAAAEALGKIGDARGRRPGRSAPCSTTRPSTVRKAAIAALGALKDREAIPALIEAAETSRDPVRGDARPGRDARRPGPAGLPPRPGRQEPGPPQGVGRARSPRSATRPRRSSSSSPSRNELPPSAVPELRKIFTRAPARSSTGRSSARSRSTTEPPFPPDEPGRPDGDARRARAASRSPGSRPRRSTREGQVDLAELYGRRRRPGRPSATPSSRARPTARPQMAVGSDDTLTVWLNGKKVYDFQDRRGFDPEAGPVRRRAASRGRTGSWSSAATAAARWQFSVAVDRRRPTTPSCKGPAAGGVRPRRVTASSPLKGQGQGRARQGPVRRPEGPGLRQVPRRRRAGGGGRPRAVERRREVPADELITSVLYPSAADLLGLRAGRRRHGRRPGPHRDRQERDRRGARDRGRRREAVKIAKADIDGPQARATSP